MKNSFLILFLVGLFSFSCQSQTDGDKPQKTTEKNMILLVGLSDEHPNKASMEWFLNNYKEEFVVSEEEWTPLIHNDLIEKGFQFHTAKSKTSLKLIFCATQKDANTVANTNYLAQDGVHVCGVNGGVLFVVQGSDQKVVVDILQWFAGEE